jgi:post-segregation antitoxin (ccd killing protein)
MRMAAATDRRRKTPTNLSVRADLIRRARSLELNLSEVLEHALEAAIRDRERTAWLAANRTAIADYNAHVQAHGVFGDDWRRF